MSKKKKSECKWKESENYNFRMNYKRTPRSWCFECFQREMWSNLEKWTIQGENEYKRLMERDVIETRRNY